MQTGVHVTALGEAPDAYAEALAGALAPAVTRDDAAEADAALADALARLDAVTERVMRIELEHRLAADASLGPPTRKVFATTVVRYAGALGTLEDRARDVAARGGAADPARVAADVVAAAARALALRAALRAGVLAVIAARAHAGAVLADGHARDRRAEVAARQAWSALRRELEAVAAAPGRLAEAPLATRLATWPAQLDEPDPAGEPTFADLIEMD